MPPLLGLGFGLRLGLVLGFGEEGSCLASEENYPLVRVRFGLGFVLGLGGGQFSSGTIVLEPFLLALLNIMKRL